ncbi:MAG TPA: M23 family metallopeptidase [Gammaproteobacteria bacterium]|nr:M23 family metallopeptidase [Gammaproteobacteria bacterium]
MYKTVYLLPLLLSVACASPALETPVMEKIPGPESRLMLEGHLTQGGLLIGRTVPGARVEYGEYTPRVSPEGVFIVGFGRDAELKQSIRLVGPDGKSETHVIDLAGREYEVQHVDGLPQEKVTPPKKEWDRIARESELIKNARSNDAERSDFLKGFIWPAEGIVSGVYGSQRILNKVPKRPHYGLDVAAPTGTPAKAPAPGIITLTHSGMFYTGGTIVIDHGHGLSSIFMHLSRIDVKEGDTVAQGQPVGAIGSTGRATGPHLHWGLYWFNTPLDPRLLLPTRNPPKLTTSKKK